MRPPSSIRAWVILIILVPVIGSSKKNKCVDFVFEKYFKDPSRPSIFYIVPAGRLGNQMLGYAIALHLKKTLGVESFVSQETHDFLTTTFVRQDVESVPVLEESFCNHYKGIEFEPYLGTFRDLVNDPQYRTGRALWLFPPGGFPGASEYGAYDSTGFNEAFEVSYEKTMKDTIRIQPRFLREADRILHGVQEKRLATQGIPKAKVFVGIHARRGDYVKFAKNTLGVRPLSEDFYNWAINKKRKEFGNKVAFIFVSDDMEWGRERLGGDGTHDIYFVGRGEEDKGMNKKGKVNLTSFNSSVDFALLASCNQTISSRGTYTIWTTSYSRGHSLTEFDYYDELKIQGP